MKPKRVKNPDLLKSYKDYKCVACGYQADEMHHIKHKGSGGDDVLGNLLPLCRTDHVKLHAMGLNTFVDKYKLQAVLLDKGWEFDEYKKKWRWR